MVIQRAHRLVDGRSGCGRDGEAAVSGPPPGESSWVETVEASGLTSPAVAFGVSEVVCCLTEARFPGELEPAAAVEGVAP